MKKSCVFILICVAMCSGSTTISRAGQFGDIQQVVLISIDGLRADALTSKHMPLLNIRLKQKGRYSLNAVNVLPSLTLPNHASMFTGLDTDHHGVNYNYDPVSRPWGFHKPEFTFPTLFSVIHTRGGSTAAFIAKHKLVYLLKNASLDYLFVETEVSANEYIKGASSRKLVDTFMRTAPSHLYTFTFFHFREVDSIGHEYGWMSNQYNQVLKAIDYELNRLLKFIARPNIAIIITADHGGDEKHHKEDKPENFTIPWAVLLPGNISGQALTSSINIVDTAPTIAGMLGLEWPGPMQGKIISLELE